MKKKIRKNKGFTVAELVVYIGVMMLALVAITVLLVNSSKIMRTVQAEKEVRVAATDSIERMTREIKNSTEILFGNSLLDDDRGRVSVMSRFTSENPQQVGFALNENGSIEVLEGNVVAGNLTSEKVNVEKLKFQHFTHGETESIRIELSLSAKTQPEKVTTFYSTAVLRGSY